MLTKKQFEDLWEKFEKANPKDKMPDYDEYLKNENMFEDYLDIFRGVNTRNERNFGNNDWYYEHPFFDGGVPKIKVPCIKYVMIGEARPSLKSPILNKCLGDENNTYFYNVRHVKNTRWLQEPFKAFFLPARPWVKPTCPSDKIAILLELASRGYVLLDLFPFSVKFNTGLRTRLNNLRISSWFFANYLDSKLKLICNFKCSSDAHKPVIAFSGPPIIHHFLAHEIANKRLPINPCFQIFNSPNYFVLPIPPIPAILPAPLVDWNPIANLLNGKYANVGLKTAPFYRSECWDGSFSGPHYLFIRNAFDL